MATPFTDFLNDVMPDVPGCPSAIALDALAKAAIVFCERTKVHKVDLTPFYLAATPVTGMPTPALSQVRVHQILQAVYGTTILEFKDADWLAANLDPNWRTLTGTPQYITQDDEESFRVAPYLTDTATELLYLYVAIKPTIGATVIDDRLWREYHEIIAAGAKARLMLSPDKPYTNPALGAVFNQSFEDAIARITHKVFKGHVRSRQRVKAHFM